MYNFHVHRFIQLTLVTLIALGLILGLPGVPRKPQHMVCARSASRIKNVRR